MSHDQLEDRARTGQLGERGRSTRGGRGDRGLATAPISVQPAQSTERGGRSGWLLLLLPLIATLAAGAWFGRSYLSTEDGTTLASTDSSQVSPNNDASAGASPAPAPSASAALGANPSGAANDIDLGQVSGRYVLKGPASTPAGSVVVFVLSGPKRAVHAVPSAPYDWSFDSRRIPNGTYTVGVTLIRPGLPAQSQNRLMEVANAKQVAPTAPATTPPRRRPPAAGPAGRPDRGDRAGPAARFRPPVSPLRWHRCCH